MPLATIDYSQPSRDEVEVSVMGAGVGESIVVHIGDGRWVIVDSYLTPDTGRPAALEYLESIEVSLEDVVAIVTTHWDDDHIGGTTELLNACKLAAFHCPAATLDDGFRIVVDERHPLPVRHEATSGVAEMASTLHLLEVLESGRRGPHEIQLGHHILTVTGEELPIRVLAPHWYAAREAARQFKDAQLSGTSTVVVPDRNLGSAVMLLESAERRVLLAGDLLNSTSPRLGWDPVLDALAPHSRAQLYKVAHHGSHRSDHPRVWDQALSGEPHAAVTAYTAHKDAVPTPENRRAIGTRTHRALLAGDSRRQRMTFLRATSGAVPTTLNKLAEQLSPGYGRPMRNAGEPGIMRFRGRATTRRVSDWRVAIDGNVVSIWRA